MQLKNAFEQRPNGYRVPSYSREGMINKTAAAPQWAHFGAGNIFRSFLAAACDTLLENKLTQTGIVLFETFDTQLIDKAYLPHNNIGINVTLCSNGRVEKSIIGSVASASYNFSDMKNAFAQKSLMLASFTITEKGYAIHGADGGLLPVVQEDIVKIGSCPAHLMSKLTALLYHRYKSCGEGLALVSMDNFFHNGDKLKHAVTQIANAAVKNGSLETGFLNYLTEKITFPCSMIDKITPRPDEAIAKEIERDGIENVEIFVTDKNTYASLFVNAEETGYLVIEDNFPNGRPPLEKAGIYLTPRETVDKAEKMKVCTCLNPLHTALAVFGCLLGYTKISDEMRDEQLVKLIERLAYKEGLPVSANPAVLNPEEFLSAVLTKRLPNPFMPDTPQRIACDTSQKMGVRFGETIKNHTQQGRKELVAIPLIIAGWLRYLMALNDSGTEMPLSPDPALQALEKTMKGFSLGGLNSPDELNKILSDKAIFGVDLVSEGMDVKIKDMFCFMAKAPGNVRQALSKYL